MPTAKQTELDGMPPKPIPVSFGGSITHDFDPLPEVHDEVTVTIKGRINKVGLAEDGADNEQPFITIYMESAKIKVH